MLLKLRSYVLGTAVLLLLFAGRSLAQVTAPTADSSDSAAGERLVVLRNGEVLHGNVVAAGERVLVTLPGREISLHQRSIDVVAATLDEAYRLKLAKVRPTDVDGRLDLATWCLRHNLLASAGDELAAAAQVQPFSPRLTALERRLQRSLAAPVEGNPRGAAETLRTPTSNAVDAARSWPPVPVTQLPIVKAATQPTSAVKHSPASVAAAESPMALERLVRSLPAPAVERFTASLQSMITHSCATAGCHAPGNPTGFTLLRLPQGRIASRRLTQRNLYNTVRLVDFAKPEESRLLKVASQPHGPLEAGVFGDQRSPKYQDLVAWVSSVTGVPVNRAETTIADGAAAIHWDRLQGATDRVPAAALPAELDPMLDRLEPNQPAEIRPVNRETSGARLSATSRRSAATRSSRAPATGKDSER